MGRSSRDFGLGDPCLAALLLWVRALFLSPFIAKETLLMFSRRVTIGYHRLYSHRAFRAAFAVRLILSLLGCMAFQGSIKVRKPHWHVVRC